ncbi:uncharacterized protein LOC113047206 isoform X3 [Carassius auratus]|uniref:Uncharacterized protein LOC113047206 isoform X3 n=1 Tax=Carassius auratus TaxID=7957 RepID=A0A6P6JZ71_CARAU|nr:uncharacterized protein LOC113047206 isoform X3 [Carassius auratus]
MSGKVWILITAVSLITHVYHVQSKCMDRDIKAHLDEWLLKEHVFLMKVFSPEMKEHALLSVINTLCSYWINNKGNNNLMVVKTFGMMLSDLDKKYEDFCANLNCTDAYTVRIIDTTTFGEMYRNSCNGSVSDLKCPSKNVTADPPGHTKLINKDDDQWATIKTCSGLLVVSFLLNIVLLLKVFLMHRKLKTSREMTDLQLREN